MMQRFFNIIAITAISILPSTVQAYDYFPENCVSTPLENPKLVQLGRQLPPFVAVDDDPLGGILDGLLGGLLGNNDAKDKGEPWLYPCTLVGVRCEEDADCPTPSEEDCKVPSDGGSPKGIPDPRRARCLDGLCRDQSKGEGEKCTCVEGCTFNTNKVLRCASNDNGSENGICVAKPCGQCGEAPAEGGCCAPGYVPRVPGGDGKCFCATGVGEGCHTNPTGCDKYSNGVCCGKGTKNDGRCCDAATCNGKCSAVVTFKE